MSKGHTAVNEFLGKKVRFADFLNGSLFQGKQIILPEELEVIKGESDILIEDKDGGTKGVHRYRDIVMRWQKKVYFVVFACETQSEIHYAMPVKKMLYDSLSYMEQTKQVWESHQIGEKVSGAEFLSRFRKEDKLIPVVTVVFYYGTQEWDGNIDLYSMFSDNEFLNDDIMKKYIPNYWINLIDVESISDIECFQTELKEIFGMMKCRKDKETLMQYMNANENYFRHVDGEAYRAISELLQTKSIIKHTVAREEMEGERDMCKALEDLYQDGIDEGVNKKLREQVQKKIQKGFSIADIADILEESKEVVERIVNELQKKI